MTRLLSLFGLAMRRKRQMDRDRAAGKRGKGK
jgi:hypothetical protein